MWFVLECWIGFLVKFIELVLSKNIEIGLKLKSYSLTSFFIHKISVWQLPTTMCLALIVKKAIEACF